MTARRIGRVSLLLALLLGGCREPLTQVVLVIQSDFKPPLEVDGMDLVAIPGPYAPTPDAFFQGFGVPLAQFPLSVGFVSGGTTDSFSMIVRLFKNVSQGNPAIAVSRSVSDIPFVDQRTMMLVLPMLKECQCAGTTCPTPGTNPDCDNIDKPAVVPFDPEVAPPSSGMGAVGGVPVTGFDGGGPVPQK